MRIMITVIMDSNPRDIVVEGDEAATIAALAVAIDQSSGRPSNVVRLPRAHAPYDLDRGRRAKPSRAELWRDGRPLDPEARVCGLLRDGDIVALESADATATVTEEPGGVIELRVVGGPGAGAVHRLGLGTHTIGADPACAIAVPDPELPAEAAVVRLTPKTVSVEPAGFHRPGRSDLDDPDTPLAPRDPDVPAVLHLDGEPLAGETFWPERGLLTCGGSAFSIAVIEPPDAHLEALPDGGLAYNRPPRLQRPQLHWRIEVPAEPKRAEGIRPQLLAALVPAVFGLVMALVFRQWYFLLIALMTPVIMMGQWLADRRHGRKKHSQALKEYQQRLAHFTAEVAAARAEDEAARRHAAPDPAEVLLTVTGPRRRLWERRIHDADALRLRLGLADLPAGVEFEQERGSPAESPLPDPPVSRNVPVALVMRRLGVAGLTGRRKVALGCARWLIGQAAALHSPRDLVIVVLSANADSAAAWEWVRWLPHCAAEGVPRDSTLAADCVTLVGADPETAARRAGELAALITGRLAPDASDGLVGGGLGGIYGTAFLGTPLSGGPAGWDDLGRPGSEHASGPSFTSYDERPCDVLVVLDGARVLRGLPGMPQVLRHGPRAGVYTIAIDDDQRLLPEECATVVACEADGSIRLRGGGLESIGRIRADQVSPSWSERLSRALSPLRDVSRDDPLSALPDSARLLDLIRAQRGEGAGEDVIDAGNMAKRWGRSTRVVIGIGPDGPFEVDISRDGPHALIAGTTGAGKSELLQTLICSLAVANRPDEMTFVLIDYKGGAAFKECVRLPHTVGMVTDLDGHLTQRALTSLAAEIRRREHLLLAAGAKDIEDYQRLRDQSGHRSATRAAAGTGHPSMPRLVLIIDEFAALVAELPDFVDGLVDIARRGRSLGIHLILATQRPGGVVTADIQANTSLRIALRVTDANESADVIGGPEAAGIAKTTPGRCYVRSGSGAATAVQTARIGGRTPAGPGTGGRARNGQANGGQGNGGQGNGGQTPRLRVTDLPWHELGRPLTVPVEESSGDGTDLTFLVNALLDAARGIPRQPSPWLPAIPDRITLQDAITAPFGSLAVTVRCPDQPGMQPDQPGMQEVPPLPFGVTDEPWAQRRSPLVLDLAQGGHLLIAGSARSGRSTALRTIAGAVATGASPEDVHIHAIDCGSGALLPLVALPHCGAVVTRDQLDRVERLLARLRAEVGRRQARLAEAGYASLAEVRAVSTGRRLRPVSPQGGALAEAEEIALERLPWLVLMLDRWEGYVAAFENYDYGRLLDAFMQLLREGPAVGLRAIVTADRSGLLGQISTVFDDRLVLRLAEPADYGLAGLPSKNLPGAMPPGRALSVDEHGLVESQIALLADDPSGPAQVTALQALARSAESRFPPFHVTGTGWRWASPPPLRVDALPIRITVAQAVELDPSFEPPSPLWALVGAGGDTLAPMGIDLLAHGPAAVITGPPRSGKTSSLITAARSLLRQGTEVLLVAPRRGALRDLNGSPGVLAVLDGNGRRVTGDEGTDFAGVPETQDLRAMVAGRDRYVVIVDDAEVISPDSPLGLALEDILRTARDGEHGLLIGGTTVDLATAYRGFVAEARKARTGLLLSVQSPADGDLFNVRLPRGAVGGPPGRGLLVTSGTVTPIQAAAP